MKKSAALKNGIAAFFDIDGRLAMKRKYRAMCRLIDPKTGITRTTRDSTVSGSFRAVGNQLRTAMKRYEDTYVR